MTVGLTGSLLRIRQNRFEVVADLDDRDAPIAGLVDDTGDNLALLVRETAEDLLIVSVTQALHDDRAGSRLGDAPEVLRSVVEFANLVAVLVLVHCHDGDATGLLVDLDAGFGNCAGNVVVRLEEGLFDRFHEAAEGNSLLLLDHAQCGHVDFHASHSSEPNSTRARAFFICAYSILTV